MSILTEPCYIRSVHQARCDLCDWSGDLTGDETEASDQAAWHRDHPLHVAALRGQP